MKRLGSKYWPIVLLFTFIIAILCMSRYAEDRKAENRNNTQSSSPMTAVAPNDASKSTQNTNKPQHPPSWIETFTWPEGVTAWSLLLTLIVIAWQSTETRAASQSMALSAKAAIEAQRARMKIEISVDKSRSDDQTKWSFDISAKNIGQTVASISEIWERIDHIKLVDLVDDKKIVPPKKRPLSEGHVVFPGESSQFGSIDGSQLCPIHLSHEIERGKTYLVWYGWIKYRDLVGAMHRRKFFYAYSWGAKRFVEFGSTGYNAEND
jgi:hypothetical protein